MESEDNKLIKLKERLNDAIVVLPFGIVAKSLSPYQIPLELGWKREHYQRGIVYTSSDGQEFSNHDSVYDYLVRTKSLLRCEQFMFNHDFNIKLRLAAERAKIVEEDVTGDEENLPIQVVNKYENSQEIDSNFEYNKDRVPGRAVNFNVDFKSCCDCEDNCVSNKCECRRLTNDAFINDVINNPKKDKSFFGYDIAGRLPHIILTGIYECNSHCHCSATCSNKNVQNGIRVILQVFMTKDRGWGVQCLHDLPSGSFVCLYNGEILTNEDADSIGMSRGDEYLTDLRYIDIVEEKEGFEEVVQISDDDEFSSNDGSIGMVSQGSIDFSALDDLGSESGTSNSEDERGSDISDSSTDILSGKKGRGIKRARPDAEASNSLSKRVKGDVNKLLPTNEHYVKVRKYMTLSDSSQSQPYVIDAKKKGNVGRFLNHSCKPNCYLSPVFVDTHDPRFPLVAFFTIRDIKAHTELTWDYSYSVGTEKFPTCKCKSANCRSKE